MEFGFEDLVGQVEREGGDALEQLKRAAAKSKELSAMADPLLDHFVERGREAGLTWAQIGEALNVSKQAAQQRSTRVVKHAGIVETVRTMMGSKPMFARFTDKARKVVVLAQEVARGLDHDYIGTEHLLSALFRVDGVGGEAMSALGLTQEKVLFGIEEKVGRGTGEVSGKVRFTPKMKKTMEMSLREALKMGHNYIGTEHLALALLGLPDSVARQILDEAGITHDALQAQITRLLEARRPPNQGEPGARQA